jgi:hypothetical protein
MKYLAHLFIVFLLSSNWAFSQKTKLESFGIIGEIKSITYFTSSSLIDTTQRFDNKVYCEFDNEGNLILEKDEVLQQTRKFYYENDNCNKIETYIRNVLDNVEILERKDSLISFKKIKESKVLYLGYYIVDSNDNYVEIVYYDTNSDQIKYKILNEFNKLGFIEKTTTFYGTDKTEFNFVYTVLGKDKNGNPIKLKIENDQPFNRLSYLKQEFEYFK